MVKWIALSILLLPLTEIVIFVLVALAIGLGSALILTIATSVAGLLVLRFAGRRQLAQFRTAVADGNITAFEASASGFMTVTGGLLLLLPGFLTDLVGGLLLIAPLQRRCAAAIMRATVDPQKRRDGVVDLTPGEWEQVPDPKLDDRRPRPPRAERPE